MEGAVIRGRADCAGRSHHAAVVGCSDLVSARPYGAGWLRGGGVAADSRCGVGWRTTFDRVDLYHRAGSNDLDYVTAVDDDRDEHADDGSTNVDDTSTHVTSTHVDDTSIHVDNVAAAAVGRVHGGER